jgi:NitT/TauT family transport system ATP-binding protein
MTVLSVVPRPAGGPVISPPYVRVSNVSKIYRSKRGDVAALSDINLDLRQGEFLSIVGPSGCGKSTLLRCVAGLAPITAGEIRIKDAPVAGPVAGTGIVFQRDLLLDWRTVLDNVLLAIEFRGKQTPEWKQRALALLGKVGLEGFADRYPWELSGGMRQRAAICRGLLADPSLLLMDEPFGALDALTRDDLNSELQTIWMETRKTVLFITHGISEAVFLSDRVAVMSPKPGRILEVIDLDLPRPRALAVRESREFLSAASRIRRILASTGAIKG